MDGIMILTFLAIIFQDLGNEWIPAQWTLPFYQPYG
jgi:hypothetical protein